MNINAFDALVQSLSAGSSRRALLAGVTTGLVAQFVQSLAGEDAAAGRRRRRRNKNKNRNRNTNGNRGNAAACPDGQCLCPEGICVGEGECCLLEKACNGGCIPVEQCCGGCPGETCCPAPRFGICVDLQTNPLHCGECNLQCANPNPGHCVDGQCVP